MALTIQKSVDQLVAHSTAVPVPTGSCTAGAGMPSTVSAAPEELSTQLADIQKRDRRFLG